MGLIETKLVELSISSSNFSVFEFIFSKQIIKFNLNEEKELRGQFKMLVYRACSHSNFDDFAVTFHILDNPIMNFTFDLRLGFHLYNDKIPKQRIFVKENPLFKDGRIDFSMDNMIIFTLDLVDSNENRMRANLKYSNLESITKLPIYDAMSFVTYLNKML